MRLHVAGALLVCGLLMTPVANAQIQNPDESTPTTLFFHVFDPFNKFVTNTQGMNADFFDVGGTNNPTVHNSPLNPVLDSLPVATGPWDLNTMYGTSTAGPVEYDFIENGKPRFHPERGIAADVILDQAVQPVVYLYLDLRDVIGTDGLPTVTGDFSVRVTMREGDDPGRNAELDAGSEIMRGEQSFHLTDLGVYPGDSINKAVYWATFMTVGLATGGGTDPGLPEDGSSALNGAVPTGTAAPDGGVIIAPGDDGIVELAIPMELMAGAIPKSEAFNIRIDWFQLDEVFGDDAFATGYIRFHASAEKQPRMEFAVMNPVYVEFLHPQVAAGTLLIHAGVNSPWGTYDLDPDNITMSVTGPSTPQALDRVVAQNQHVHGLHDKAAEITYLWSFRDEGAAEGDYTISMQVPNADGTAVAKATAGFTIEGKQAFGISDQGKIVEPTVSEESQDSPAAGLALIGLLAAALVAIRRQRA